MIEEMDEAMCKFGSEVLHLIDLYRTAADTLSQAALTAFNLQLVLVEALAQVAVLPVIRATEKKVPTYPKEMR